MSGSFSTSSEQANSGSNFDWTAHPFALEDAYDRLSSEDFFCIMVRGSLRAKKLLSKETDLDLDDKLVNRLSQLVDSFEDLVLSVRKLWTTEELYAMQNYPEMSRLVQLAKRILENWEGIENVIAHRELSPVSALCMAPVDYSQTVPSAWLFDYHWRDGAYKEVLSIRKKYSYLLDQAYIDSYTSYLRKDGTVSCSILLSQRKLLNLMASSREDFEYIQIEKCYKRVMSMKELCTQMRGRLELLCGSENLTDQMKPPNWRDDIYDQVVAYRKMYSLEMDKLLLDIVINKMRNGTPPEEADKELCEFLYDSLQFLANSRQGIAVLREEYCREQLAIIKRRLEDNDEFLSLRQEAEAEAAAAAALQSSGQNGVPKSLNNWRDLEYDVLQNKTCRFLFEVHDVYLKYKAVWSKIEECREGLKKLENHINRALGIYKMRRGDMSLYSTCELYHKSNQAVLKKDVDECIRLIRLLLRCLADDDGTCAPRWGFCKPDILIPRARRFADYNVVP